MCENGWWCCMESSALDWSRVRFKQQPADTITTKITHKMADGSHSFGKKTFHKPTYCHHCSDLLWGLIGQGHICEGIIYAKIYQNSLFDTIFIIQSTVLLIFTIFGSLCFTKKKLNVTRIEITRAILKILKIVVLGESLLISTIHRFIVKSLYAFYLFIDGFNRLKKLCYCYTME